MGILYRLQFANGKSYVGITRKTFELRFREHARCAASSKYRAVVYSAWRKHGAPSLAELRLIPDGDLLAAEVAEIAVLGTVYPGGYNTTPGGDESPAKTPSVAAKISAAKMGRLRGKVHSDESRERLRMIMSGKRMSPETKAKLSAAKKGVPSQLKGRKLSPERCAQMSAAMLARPPHSEGRRAKISAGLTGKKQSAETVAKRVEKVKATWAAKRAANV